MPLYLPCRFTLLPLPSLTGGLAWRARGSSRCGSLTCSPLRRPLREGERTALTADGAGKIRTGDRWCSQAAGGRPGGGAPRRAGPGRGPSADHARLGVIERQLDAMTGQPGVIGQVAAQVMPRGKVKGTARRSMTMAAALRAALLMALMPEAGYGEILWLCSVTWPWCPGTCRSRYRRTRCWPRGGTPPARRPPAVQDMVLAASDAEHLDHDYRAIAVGDLQLCSVDGSVTRMPDTPANRAGFGSARTSDDSSPYPQLRDLPVTDASTRGMLAVVTGPSGGDKAEAEQALLDRALSEYAWVFTKRRLFAMDRNFPGVTRIRRLVQGTHVLIRIKSDITVTKTGDFLPDGSYMADVGGGDHKIRMRVIEYYADVEGQDVPEMFCLVTDLDDWRAYPAAVLAAAYKWRWDGSAAALREAKSAIRGAGPSTGPIFRSRTPRHDPPGARRLDHRHRTRPRRRPPGGTEPPRPARDAAPASPSTRGRSPSLPPAAPPSPPPATGPPLPACPALSPAPRTRTPSTTWADAASPSTGTGTATTRPRPARHSPPPGARSPPARRPRSSPSAARSPPEAQPRQPHPTPSSADPWNRPPPRSDIRAPALPRQHNHRQ